MSDPAETAQRLLNLAGDAAASENEIASAARRAARLFREHGLRISNADDERRLTCVMCQPADRGYGTCPKCGLICRGPGHACSDPEPGTLCAAHATWVVSRPPRPPPPSFGFGGPMPGTPFRGVLPFLRTPSEMESFSNKLREATDLIQKLRARVAELEAENARLRAPRLAPLPSPDALMHVRLLELPVRIERVLKHAGIELVGELARMSVSDLLEVPGLGKRSIREIRRAIRLKSSFDLGAGP